MRRIVRISLGVVITAGAGFCLLMLASIHAFHELTEESLIAEIEFDRAGEQQFVASLRTGDFCSARNYSILGDQWRIDAQFLKWHYWATAIGLDSQYRLERLEGRYLDAAEQNSKPTLAHPLAEPAAIDIGKVSGRLGRLNFLADASYGTSTYHDIDPSQVYLVYKTPTGILTRARVRITPQTDDTILTAEVRRGCGEKPGLVATAADWLNRTVDRVD